MAKRIKLKNDMYLDTKYSVHNDTILYDYLNELKDKIGAIKMTTLWSKSKGAYGENRISFDATKYDLFIIEYNLYTATDYYSSKVITTLGRIYEISDRFIYNNKYYGGRRDFFFDNNGAYIYQATNDIYTIDNAWYNPVKIVGINLGGGGGN